MFLEQVVLSHHHVGHRTEGTVITYLTSQTLRNKEYHPYDTHCNIYSSWTLVGMLRECRSKKWQNIFRSNVPTSLQHASLLLSSVSNTTSFVHSCNTTNPFVKQYQNVNLHKPTAHLQMRGQEKYADLYSKQSPLFTHTGTASWLTLLYVSL
jgi:hypothetical protein